MNFKLEIEAIDIHIAKLENKIARLKYKRDKTIINYAQEVEFWGKLSETTPKKN